MLHRPEADARVVLLPGARYSTQAPLLWFAREIALARGMGALEVLDELPSGGNPFAWGQDRAERALRFEPARLSVVVGKSAASAATGLVGDRGMPALWLTPLLNQRLVVEGLSRAAAPTMLIGGTLDETWTPDALPASSALEVVELPGVDHSLQVPGDVTASFDALGRAIAAIERFVAQRGAG